MLDAVKNRRRRWLSFSLGTMLVVVAVTCVFAAWITFNLNWIRQRHRFAIVEEPAWRQPVLGQGGGPGMLWMFGEAGFQTISKLVDNESEVEPMRTHLKSLFPEAETDVMTKKEYFEWIKSRNPGILDEDVKRLIEFD